MKETKFTGEYVKSQKPYLKKIKGAKSIHVSDYTPNERFQKVEDSGYKEVFPTDYNTVSFEGKDVWYRRSTTMGRSRVYIKINN